MRLLPTLVMAVLPACAAAAVTPEPVRIPVRMTEFSYGAAVIGAPAGVPILLAVTNTGKVDHDLVIDELDLRVLLRPGASEDANLGSLAARTYVAHCSIPTHRELGMTVALVVR